VSIPGEITFYLLDDTGLLFNADRAEIYHLNTSAAFIWCCLEEGMTCADIAAAYTDAFAVSADDADSHVAEMLGQWQGLGYIEDAAFPAPPPIDFTTALGRLLALPRLLAAFSRAPAETARRIGVRQKDLESFLLLNPDELEKQARTLRQKVLSKRHRADINLFHRTSADETFQPVEKPAVIQDYLLLTTRFHIRYASSAQLESVHPTLKHLAIPDGDTSDLVIDILDCGDEHVVLENGEGVARCPSLNHLAPSVKSRLRQSVINRHDYFMQIHGAAVMTDEHRCILMPAAPGSGKTTLSAALAASGMYFLSDEVALLEDITLQVCPMPFSMAVKAGSVEALADYYPCLKALPQHMRQDEHQIRYLAPPAAALQYPGNERYQIQWIIFPRYQPGTTPELRPLGRGDALQRLLDECLVIPAALDRKRVGNLIQWLQGVECFEMSIDALPQATDLIIRTCR